MVVIVNLHYNCQKNCDLLCMKSYENFVYQNFEYPLSHLNPLYVEYIQPAKGDKNEKRYRCLIEFSHHCFTKSPNIHKNEALSDYPRTLHYKTAKEIRIWDWERYELSKRLPNILKNLDKQKCFFTSANDKFLTISVQNKSGEIVDYEIYFSLKKSRTCDVHIFINSAYLRSNDYKPLSGKLKRKPISFFVLLNNTITNKRIKRPK